MVVFGNYSAYLTEVFFVDKGKAYDTEDPISGQQVRDMMNRYPDAFSSGLDPTPPPPPVVEQATAAPGEVRRTGKTGRG